MAIDTYITQSFDINYGDNDLWTSSNPLFKNVNFNRNNRSSTQQVFIRNDASQSAQIRIQAKPRNGAINTGIAEWVKFGNSATEITHTGINHTLEPKGNTNDRLTYWIKIEIPVEDIDTPNAPTRFPLEDLVIQVTSFRGSTKQYVFDGADDFSGTNSQFFRNIDGSLHNILNVINGIDDDDNNSDLEVRNRNNESANASEALRRRIRPPGRNPGTWSAILDVSEFHGTKFHADSVTGSAPGNTSITKQWVRISTTGDLPPVNQRNTKPYNESFTSESAQTSYYTHPYYYLQLKLDDANVSASADDNLRTSITNYTLILLTRVRHLTPFDSILRHEVITGAATLGKLPDGIVILDKNELPKVVPNTKVESFKYGYTRAGGNDNFTLKLRTDWDDPLDIEYDYTLLYVDKGKTVYRGIIDRIRTHLQLPESIEISGAGLSKQLTSIQVNDRFSEQRPNQIIPFLLKKYLTGTDRPNIISNVGNITGTSNTSTFNFQNENLFDVINKIANSVGANPTGKGDSGNDIIWGIDENKHFYFLQKSTDLAYQFHTGRNISFDDLKEAPNFNVAIFTGNTQGYELENYIPDGDCELFEGSSDEDFFQVWNTGRQNTTTQNNTVPVTITRDTQYVAHGSQAYQIRTNHPHAANRSTGFRSIGHRVPDNEVFHLSFYARCETSANPQLRIFLNFTVGGNEDRLYRFETTLTQVLRKYEIKNIPSPYKAATNAVRKDTKTKIAIAFTSNLATETITLDAIYLHRNSANIPGANANPTFTKVENLGEINLYSTTIEATPLPTEANRLKNPNTNIGEDNIGGHTYSREVFASDGKYEIVISDLTAIKEFGRRKEIIQEVDAITNLQEAYQYGRAILGTNSSETRRGSLRVTNNKNILNPFKLDVSKNVGTIEWGYARIYGSTNPDTRYEYSIISIQHEIVNDQTNSTVELGAPRASISEMVRRLTARSRFKGSTGGAASTNAPTIRDEDDEETPAAPAAIPRQYFGTTLPTGAATNSTNTFTGNATGLTNYKDTDGMTDLTTANNRDVAQFDGSQWVKVQSAQVIPTTGPYTTSPAYSPTRYGTTLPTSAVDGDIFIFEEDVTSGLDYRDKNGTTPLAYAKKLDVVRYNGELWVYQTNLDDTPETPTRPPQDTYGTELPPNPVQGDTHTFSSDVSAGAGGGSGSQNTGIQWYDVNGTTVLTEAKRTDVAKYYDGKWIKQLTLDSGIPTTTVMQSTTTIGSATVSIPNHAATTRWHDTNITIPSPTTTPWILVSITETTTGGVYNARQTESKWIRTNAIINRVNAGNPNYPTRTESDRPDTIVMPQESRYGQVPINVGTISTHVTVKQTFNNFIAYIDHVGKTTLGFSTETGERAFHITLQALVPSATTTAPTTSTATPTAIASQIHQVSGNGQAARRSMAITNPLIVEVRDQNRKPISGSTIQWSQPSTDPAGLKGTLSSTSTTTDTNGRAQITYTLGATPGENKITARIGTTGPSTTFLVYGQQLIGKSASLVSGNSQTTTPRAVLNPFVVQVLDQADNPLQGTTVRFSIQTDTTKGPDPNSGASLSVTEATTDSNGRAQTVLTVGTQSGNVTVRAKAFGILQTIDFTATSSTPTASTIRVKSGTGQSGATGGRLTPFVVEVLDQFGNVYTGANATVNWAITAGGGSIPSSSTSNSSGEASAVLTLGSSTGTNTVRATLANTSSNVLISATAQTPVATTIHAISGTGQSGATNTDLPNPFVIEVRDQSGNVLTTGATVTFAVTAGGGSTTPTSATTNSSGRAQTVLRLGTDTATTNTVRAQISGKTANVLFNATAQPRVPTTLTKISGDNQTYVVGKNLMNPFVIEVRDQANSPDPNVAITFAVTAGGGTTNPTSTNTDSNGRAQTVLQLGANPGTNTVRASASGISSNVTFTATAQARMATSIHLISGNSQTGNTGQPLSSPLVVEVRDQAGEALANQSVTFAVTGGDGSVSHTNRTTDTNGRAQTVLTLGTTAGTNTVTASVSGVSSTIQFTATGSVATATSIHIISGNNQNYQRGLALRNPFVVEVRDQSNNIFAGATVTWSIQGSSGGSLSTMSTTTDANGRAQVTYTLNNSTGDKTVRATISGTSTSVDFTATAHIYIIQLTAGQNFQTQAAGTTLANSFKVTCTGNGGASDPGVGLTINWAVTGGGGSMSHAESTTNTQGIAESTLTLGTTPGRNNVTATLAVDTTRVVYFAADGT